MIQSPEDRQKIRKLLEEISNSMTRMDAEKDFIREAIKDASDQYKLPKRTLSKMAKTFHKQNFHKEQADYEEFETLYQTVIS